MTIAQALNLVEVIGDDALRAIIARFIETVRREDAANGEREGGLTYGPANGVRSLIYRGPLAVGRDKQLRDIVPDGFNVSSVRTFASCNYRTANSAKPLTAYAKPAKPNKPNKAATVKA